METLRQDIRYALRMLWRTRGLTLVVLATVALCVGANTALFAVVHAALLRPLPYPEAESIVVAGDQAPGLFLDWRRDAGSFSAMAAFRSLNADVTGFDRPERLEGAVVTASFFDVMRVQPSLGRTLSPQDDQTGARVIVLGDSYWRRRFAADPQVVGKSIALDGERYTIVGVMPAGFTAPIDAHAWVPPHHIVPEHPLRPTEDATQNRGSHYLGVCARLRPGVTIAAATAEQRAIFERVRQQNAASVTKEDVDVRLMTWREFVLGDDVRPALLVLLAAVGLVLLIGCANIANLMLARSAARQQEITVRAALGAGRLRLVRQFITESVVLSILGGAAGALIVAWTLPTLTALSPQAVRDVHAELNLPVLLFALAASLLTGVLFGCLPALHAANGSLADGLRSSIRATGGRRGNRVRNTLTVAEIAVSLALLAGAGLMIRTFLTLRHVDPGFKAEGLQTLRVELPAARYATPARQALFFDQLLDRLRSSPGVSGVAAAARLPFAGGNSTRGIQIDHAVSDPQPWGGIRVISATYFDVMGISIRRGRAFSSRDREGAPLVAIVNDAMARKYWTGEDPVGHRFAIGTGPWIEIVGVAGDVKHDSLREPAGPEFYLPFQQSPWSFMSIVVKSPLTIDALAAGIERDLASIDPSLPMPPVRPMTTLLKGSVSIDQFEMLGLVVFAGIALALATVGLYGVMSYLVGRRTRELGLRLALGARPSQILTSVVMDGLRLAGLGLILGLGLSLIVSRALQGALFGVRTTDPITLISVAAILGVVAVAASVIPARRAMHVDPIVALRME
ncbi:MAG TPA: ABC transporter permease [Vicinamibacterales bacterium]|nr:ABC transporter permease [Vicinamibacterales bacterium]